MLTCPWGNLPLVYVCMVPILGRSASCRTHMVPGRMWPMVHVRDCAAWARNSLPLAQVLRHAHITPIGLSTRHNEGYRRVPIMCLLRNSR